MALLSMNVLISTMVKSLQILQFMMLVNKSNIIFNLLRSATPFYNLIQPNSTRTNITRSLHFNIQAPLVVGAHSHPTHSRDLQPIPVTSSPWCQRTVTNSSATDMTWYPWAHLSGKSTLFWYTLLSTVPDQLGYLPVVIVTQSHRPTVRMVHAASEGWGVRT